MGEGKKGERSDARRPQSCHEVNACVGLFLNFIYTCLAFSHSPPSSLLLAFVFLFLSGLPPSVGRLNFVACWLCLAPSKFMTRECNPLTPKAPIMMGGTQQLASVKETRIFPYGFVQQRRSLKNFLAMKVRSVLAGSRSHCL